MSKIEDPFEDWVNSDLYHYKIRLRFLAYTNDLSKEQVKNLEDMIYSKDPESVELAKEVIMNLKSEDERKES